MALRIQSGWWPKNIEPYPHKVSIYSLPSISHKRAPLGRSTTIIYIYVQCLFRGGNRIPRGSASLCRVLVVNALPFAGFVFATAVYSRWVGVKSSLPEMSIPPPPPPPPPPHPDGFCAAATTAGCSHHRRFHRCQQATADDRGRRCGNPSATPGVGGHHTTGRCRQRLSGLTRHRCNCCWTRSCKDDENAPFGGAY